MVKIHMERIKKATEVAKASRNQVPRVDIPKKKPLERTITHESDEKHTPANSPTVVILEDNETNESFSVGVPGHPHSLTYKFSKTEEKTADESAAGKQAISERGLKANGTGRSWGTNHGMLSQKCLCQIYNFRIPFCFFMRKNRLNRRRMQVSRLSTSPTNSLTRRSRT